MSLTIAKGCLVFSRQCFSLSSRLVPLFSGAFLKVTLALLSFLFYDGEVMLLPALLFLSCAEDVVFVTINIFFVLTDGI